MAEFPNRPTYQGVPLATVDGPDGLTIRAPGGVSIQGNYPGFWLDETISPFDPKGCYIVLDQGVLQFQRRATDFGAYEAQPMTFSILSGIMKLNNARVHTDAYDPQPAGAAFTARPGANQLDIASSVFTKVNFGAEMYDPSACYDPVSSTYTAQVAGLHRFFCGLSFDGGVAGYIMFGMLYKNGVRHRDMFTTATAAGYFGGAAYLETSAVVGDKFTIYIWHNQPSVGAALPDIIGKNPEVATYFGGGYMGPGA